MNTFRKRVNHKRWSQINKKRNRLSYTDPTTTNGFRDIFTYLLKDKIWYIGKEGHWER